jgi:hypothetical protein
MLKGWAYSYFNINYSRVSPVKTQLIYCQLKWRQVSTQGVDIRPITEPRLRYTKWKCTFSGLPKCLQQWENVPRSLTHVPRSLTHVPRSVTHVPRSLTHVPRSLTRVPRSLTHVERSLIIVNILGSRKCALSLGVPQMWFNNWPDDDSMSRNMSPF